MASPIALRIAQEPAGIGTPVNAASEVTVDQTQRQDRAYGGRLTILEGTAVTLTACTAALDLSSSCVVG